jgi:glycosidase
MMGAHDPDCRRPFNWEYTEDAEKVSLRDYYKKLIQIRKENSCLRTGSFDTLIAEGMVYAYLRRDENSSISVIINNDTNRNKIKVPFNSSKAINLLTRKEYPIKEGVLDVELDAMSGMILKFLN